jgi:AcrR family transcriptional regulator
MVSPPKSSTSTRSRSLVERAIDGVELGRPPLHGDEEILAAALHAFAEHGFGAMSLRALNADLGLSHGAIGKRFESKERLFFAAVDHGFARFFDQLAQRRAMLPRAKSELDELRLTIHAFILAAADHPTLGRLMLQEGVRSTDRLDYILSAVIEPAWRPVSDVLQHLISAGQVRPVTSRALFFLVAQGAAIPFAAIGLSSAFDESDGPIDPEAHAEVLTDVIVRGLRTR